MSAPAPVVDTAGADATGADVAGAAATGVATTTTTKRQIIPPLLIESRGFRRLFAGQAISLFGDQISLLALPLVAVLALDASPAQMGYLAAAGLAPNLLFALPAGALVDRYGHRRQVMVVADLARAALLLSVPIGYAFGLLSLGPLYVVAFAAGTFSVLFAVSYSVLFVSVVPRERYVQGTSLLNGSRALSFVGGPSLSGLLVQLLTAPVTLIVDALSYLASALFLGGIRAPEPAVGQTERGHLVAGMRFIARNSIIRASLLCSATINFFNFVFWALLVLYASRELHVRPGLLGAILGAAAIGGVIGSVITGRVGRRIGIGPAYLLGCLLFTAPLLLVPLAGGPQPRVMLMLFLAEFGSGLGVMLLDISAMSISAALVPDRLRSRVAGAFMLVNYGVRPLGSLAGGALGATIGLRPTLWIASAGAITGLLWALPSPLRKLRDLPEQAD
jgi:MFS family permease